MAESDKKEADKETSGSQSSTSSDGATCSSCSQLDISFHHLYTPSRYPLKEGEMLYDFEGSTASQSSLNSYVHVLCASSVYRMFFAYTQVMQRDSSKCSSTFHRHPEKNRFSDIPCFEETRVKVKHPDEDHDYIHANWADGYREPKKFIIAQAPLKETFQQFWHMIWENKTTIIVSMVQSYDHHNPQNALGFIPVKKGAVVTFGDVTVKSLGTRTIRSTYDATVLSIKRGATEKERRVLQLTYFQWFDKGTPTNPTEALNFIADFNHNRELLIADAKTAGWIKDGDKSPIVVHCLTGAGRSCTLIALDICRSKLDDTVKRPCGPLVDIEDVVMRLRTQRAMAVQKAEQYLFLHLAVLEHAVRMGYIADETWQEIDLSGYIYRRARSSSSSSRSSDG